MFYSCRERRRYVDLNMVIISLEEHGGAAVERRTPEQEVRVRNIPPPCCVLEQDTLLFEKTGNTQEETALPRHD